MKRRLHPAQVAFHGSISIALAGLVMLAGCAEQQAGSSPTSGVTAQLDEPEPAADPTDAGSPADAGGPADAGNPADKGDNSADDNGGDQVAAGQPAEPSPEPSAPEDDPQPADVAAIDDHPFPRRIDAPEFPKDMDWLNVSGPLRRQDLKGKFVLLDFWTYCCINCIHILPELKKLERAYPNELVVIGVHSAKFENEKDSKNIQEAILRYEIEHPVINDKDHEVWNLFGASSWPTILLLDPEGNAVWGRRGEVKFDEVDAILKRGLPYYREKKTLDETPLRFELLSYRQKPTPLRFPGKVLADEAQGRLFITDSNHNRIVICSLEGELQDVIGSGAIGAKDGGYADASFDHPQGLALHGETLYVSDTENHLLRKVDLAKKQVSTIAGTGSQARVAWPGLDALLPSDDLPERWVGPPAKTGLNSPWALWVHQDDLYIAMAGPHQIWKMPLDESEIGPYAGNGREDIVDGPLLPERPYEQGYSSFAQPSGLTSDGTWLYVADSEGSSIRAVPFDGSKEVKTVVGTNELPYGRLFEFGDRDGARGEVLMQHCLGVTYRDGTIYTVDTYNNKVKAVDAKTGETRTFAGTGKPGLSDEPAQFDEPAGISHAGGKLFVADTNNHAIRTVDLESGEVQTLTIAGLSPPKPPQVERKPSYPGAAQVKLEPANVKPVDGAVQMAVELQLPAGWKINPLAPMSYYLEAKDDSGAIDRDALGLKKLKSPATEFQVRLPAAEGSDALKLSMRFYYCQEGNEGLCKVGSVTFSVPLTVSSAADQATVTLRHKVAQ